MSKGKWLGAALLGAVAGATFGVLFAPRSGQETRKLIKKKAEEAKNKTKDLAIKGEKTVQTIASQTQEAIQSAKKAIEKKLK